MIIFLCVWHLENISEIVTCTLLHLKSVVNNRNGPTLPFIIVTSISERLVRKECEIVFKVAVINVQVLINEYKNYPRL